MLDLRGRSSFRLTSEVTLEMSMTDGHVRMYGLGTPFPLPSRLLSSPLLTGKRCGRIASQNVRSWEAEAAMLVKVQILLRKEWRTPEGIATVKRIAASLGIAPTASGAASVSGAIESKAFEALFGVKARRLSPRPRSGTDSGSPGSGDSGALRVPEPLQEYVGSITVAPPHLRMS